jgi:hypothetical protein
MEQVDIYRHPGVQWLSLTPTERDLIVSGYIQGYGDGKNQACWAADKLFENDKPQSGFPSVRCRESVEQYSHIEFSESGVPDFSPYTNAITEFYTKHPEYRDIPYVYLMQFLTGAKHKTADDLYSMAQTGTMITRW